MPNLPRVIRFQGHIYLRVEAVMEARAAEFKMRQLQTATDRAPRAKLVNLADWDVGEAGVLSAINTKDSGLPMLLLWNPVTSEFLMSSDRDLDVVNHSEFFKKMQNKVKDYPLPNIRDWVRASVDQSSKVVTLWPWEPLLGYSVYLHDAHEKRQVKQVQAKANPMFEQLVSELGSGNYSFRTIKL